MSQATQAVEPSSSGAPPVFSRIHTVSDLQAAATARHCCHTAATACRTAPRVGRRKLNGPAPPSHVQLLERLQHIKEQKRRVAYGDAIAVSTLETTGRAEQGAAGKGPTTGAVAATGTTGGAANPRTKLVDFSGGVIRRRSHSMGDTTKRRLIAAAVRAAVPDVAAPQPAERATTSADNGGWSTTGEGGGGGVFASRNSHRLLMSLPDGPHASLVRRRHSVAGPSASHAPEPSSDPSAAAGAVGRLRPQAELLASPSPAEPQRASAAAAAAAAAGGEEEEEDESDEEDASSGEEEEEEEDEVEGGEEAEEVRGGFCELEGRSIISHEKSHGGHPLTSWTHWLAKAKVD